MNVVFAIGCKRYRDPDVARLQYSDRDAKRFIETVMGTQEPDNTEHYLLHDEHENEDFRPTRANILYFLSRGERRDKSNELDFLFFYFSGHGWSSQYGTDYLLTSDSLVNMPDETAISVPMLEGHLRAWEANHAVLFIDACRTVRAGGKSITIQDESRIDVDSLCPPGMVTFCSCEPGQTSYEANPIRSGVFTEAVCKALSDEGRCSTIEELDKYLNDQVPRISDVYGLPRQTPYSRVEPLVVRKASIVSQRTREAWKIQERRKRLNELYAQARSLYQNRDWQAVIGIFEQIRVEDSSYSDPEGLLVSAHEALEAQDLGRRVAAVYTEGQRHMEAREWEQALEFFEEVQRLEPGYRDTEQLLSQVRQELEAPPTVEVPDLTGQEDSQASSTLASKDLMLAPQREVSSDTVPEGQIIEQSPEAGTEVKAGSVVSVTVSSGLSTVEVPDLVGKDHYEARTSLDAAKLKLGERVKAPSGDVADGRIVEQDPVAGTKAKRGSSVRLTISSGPQENAAAAPSEQRGAETAQAGMTSTESSVTRDQDGRRPRPNIPHWAIPAFVAALAILSVVVVIIIANQPQPTTKTLSGFSGDVNSVSFSRDSKLLGSADNDSVKLWDPQSGKLLQTLIKGNWEGGESLAFSPDGKLLASGAWENNSVKLWDPQSGKLLRTLTGHSSSVRSLAFSPDGKLLASGGGFDHTVKLWDPQSGKLLQTLIKYGDNVTAVDSVAFSPDGELLAIGKVDSKDDNLELWDPQSGKLLRILSGNNDYCISVAFSPDGKLLACGGSGGVELWDPQNGKLLRTLSTSFDNDPDDVNSVSFSPDGELLAGGTFNGHTVKLWDPQSGKLLRTLTGHSKSVNSVAFNNNGELLASSSDDKTVKLWERTD